MILIVKPAMGEVVEREGRSIVSKKPAACPAEVTVNIIGGRWKLVILYWLRERAHRFGELRRQIPGATEQMLTVQLRQLEADGLVHREVFREIPPRVEYSLTDLGQTISPVLDALCDWGAAFESSQRADAELTRTPVVDPTA